jgi:N-methylhydantoinase B/oxoprolinase/acetone carboxylase alpha subunit
MPLLSGHHFNYDEMFKFESTGGGGWGNPHERPAEKVLEDVLDDYVSIEMARDTYGVVIDQATMKIDANATNSLRAS